MKNYVAAIQMTSGDKVAKNLQQAEELIAKAVSAKAKLLVLPEMFPIIGKTEFEKMQVSEAEGVGPIQNFLSNQAAKNKVWIVGGTIPLLTKDPTKVRSACLVYNDEGKQVARYDKIHMFDVFVGEDAYKESNTIEPGDKAIVVDTPFGKLGLAICYDIRFPELAQSLVAKGAMLIAVPTAFTAITGAAHWNILLRALAIQSQCYVIAGCQAGLHPNGRQTHGDSMIIDPWGTVMEHLTAGLGVVTAEIDLTKLQQIRDKMPLQQQRCLIK